MEKRPRHAWRHQSCRKSTLIAKFSPFMCRRLTTLRIGGDTSRKHPSEQFECAVHRLPIYVWMQILMVGGHITMDYSCTQVYAELSVQWAVVPFRHYWHNIVWSDACKPDFTNIWQKWFFHFSPLWARLQFKGLGVRAPVTSTHHQTNTIHSSQYLY